MDEEKKDRDEHGGKEEITKDRSLLEADNSAGPDSPPKKLFGRGIYGSRDVPIRLLDGLIAALIAAAVILTVAFTVNGGFLVTFDSQGGTPVESQKLRYGKLVTEPQAPEKPGYDFVSWYDEKGEKNWRFEYEYVTGDMTLTAVWTPAAILVKFDLDGGAVEGQREIPPVERVYGQPYGELPHPEKAGFRFAGWMYSGQMIDAAAKVSMTGEHMLTAIYEPLGQMRR